MEGILDDIILDGDLTVSDVKSEDIGLEVIRLGVIRLEVIRPEVIRLEVAGLNPMEVNSLDGGLELALSSELGMVLEAGFVLRTYLVETITETMGVAVETGESDAADLLRQYQLRYDRFQHKSLTVT